VSQVTPEMMPAHKHISLPHFSLRHPVTVVMVTLSLFVLGLIALDRMPLEFLMRIDVPILSVYIPYPGALPEQVEREVAIPVEAEFRMLSALERINTWSDGNGCSVMLRYAWDTDMRLAAAELRDFIERLKLKLPDEVDRVFIRRFSSDTAPVLRFALFRGESQDELAQWARTVLKGRLMRIKGVADVEVSGRDHPEVYIEFDQGALQARGLSLHNVVQTLRQVNISAGVGSLDAARHRYLVRVDGQLETPAGLEEIALSADGVRLREVAQVRVLPPEGASDFSVDGQRGVFVNVLRESEANTVATCDAVRAELARLPEEPGLEDAAVFIFDDQAAIIRYALGQLYTAGTYGAFLAFAVLLLFLRNMRATVLVALMTPASLVVALVYLFFSGRSLNLVSIAAMIVALGMLVDNAIVVIENIHRLHALGGDRRDNILRGAAEVGLAITASTLTTIVVFIPVLYMDAGEMSLIMREFAGPVTTALLASLVLALTVLPLAEDRLAGLYPQTANGDAATGRWGRFRRAFTRMGGMLSFQGYYKELLRTTLARRPAALGMLAICIGLTYAGPFREVGLQDMPSLDLRQVRVQFRADPNYGPGGVQQTVARMETALNDRREELGIKNLYIRSGGWGGEIRVYLAKEEDLKPGEQFPYSTEEVRDSLSVLLPRAVPGATIDCGVARADLGEEQRVSVHLRGDDSRRVRQYAEAFLDRLEQEPQPALKDTQLDRPEDEQELQLRVDLARAAAVGATPLFVASTVDFALRGTRLPPLRSAGEETPVWARFRAEDRRGAEDLLNISVPGMAGGLIPVGRLARVERAPTPPALYRENGKNVMSITGTATDHNLTRVQGEISRSMERFEMERGYSMDLGERFSELAANFLNFKSALVLAVVLIYIVMAALFESLLLPLSILTTVPLAFVGVYWSMYLTDTPLDTVALVGSILMCGVIVNNGIVIVDCINELRRGGMDRFDAILGAAVNRLRPVLMTTLTTILGTLPIAIGSSGESSALTSLGRSFVGGITAGTMLTLFAVPLAYTLVDDFRVWVAGFLAGFRRSRRAEA